MQQYFVNSINNNFVLTDDDFRHLTVVMRAKSGDEIICVNEGVSYLCRFIKTIDSYEIEKIKVLDIDSELKVKVKIYQALIRNENFDLVVQKATELGASIICPTIFKRNVVKIEPKKEEQKITRYSMIAKNASEQSKRQIVPLITNLIKVEDISLSSDEIGLVAYEKCNDTKSLVSLEDELKKAKMISVVIGPEGGIEKQEYESLIKKGFKSVSLGKRILRSETASLNILSILSYILEIK